LLTTWSKFHLEIGAPKWAHGATDGSQWWEIGGVFEASTGVPFTPVSEGRLGVKSTDPNIDVPTWCPVRVAVRSSIRQSYALHQNAMFFRAESHYASRKFGPQHGHRSGLVNLDFSLFKNNHVKRISDTFNAQFRTEFFNVVNHTNFAPPLDNRNIFDSAGSQSAMPG